MMEKHEQEDVEMLFRSLGFRQLDRVEVNSTWTGKIILFVTVLCGILYVYAAIVSKFLPDTGVEWLDFFKYDFYFCFLIPLLIFPTYSVIYLNWLAMKSFEHN
jgi:hypothetical protein